jgi:hypothetical protein
VQPHPGHTRAYIHHLLNAREMLGDVLLSAHNTVHFARLMGALRATTDAGAAASSSDPSADGSMEDDQPRKSPQMDLAGYRAWLVRTNGFREDEES